jgi:hypothetical protein
MEGFILFVLIVLISTGLYLYFTNTILQEAFIGIGSMRGLSYGDIVSVVGRPSFISFVGDWKICEWNDSKLFGSSYSIKILFNREGSFQRIISEHIG